MKAKVIGRVFGAGGKLIPVGTIVDVKSVDGVFYAGIETPKTEKVLEVATPTKKRLTRKSKDPS